MSFRVKLNQAQFASDVRRLMKLTNKTMGEVLDEQAGLFARDGMRFTPPFGNAPITESFTIQRKAGENAIITDIVGGGPNAFKSNPKAGIFVVLPSSMVNDSERRKRSGNVFVFADKTGRAYGVDQEHWKVDAPISELLEHHNRMRSPRTGRVTSAGSRTRDVGRWRFLDKFVIRDTQFEKLKKVLFARVGLAKAGWVLSLTNLGKASRGLPAWVKKQARGVASGIFKRSGIDTKAKVTVGNAVPYVQRFAEHVEKRAWANRMRNFPKQIEQTAKALARKARTV